jgi:hypothetical protein
VHPVIQSPDFTHQQASAVEHSYSNSAALLKHSQEASNVWPEELFSMAQAGPVTDVVQRLFTELKSKNEETRVRASYELYDNVLTVSRGTCNKIVGCIMQG